MSVAIRVPGVLRRDCEGRSEISLSAGSVSAALQQLEVLYPSLYRSVCDERGLVRRHVNVFVNSANVRDLAGLESTLVPGDVVTILPAVSGG